MFDKLKGPAYLQVDDIKDLDWDTCYKGIDKIWTVGEIVEFISSPHFANKSEKQAWINAKQFPRTNVKTYCSDCSKTVDLHIQDCEKHVYGACDEKFDVCGTCGSQNVTSNTGVESS